MKLKKIVINYAKKHHWMMSFIRYIRKVYGKTRYLFYFLTTKIDDNMIVFESFMGKKYVDSPKAIYEYMVNEKKYKNYKFIWFFKEPEKYKYLEKK